MAPNPRVKAAFQAMTSIGIPNEKTKPALKRLLKLFDKNWDLIEEENYRVLADAIFEYEDTEVAEKEKKSAAADQRGALEEESQLQDEPERPLKRLRLKHQGQATPSNGQPSSSSGVTLLIPKPEPGEPEDLPNQRIQPSVGSAQVSPQPVARNKGKQPISPQNMGVVAGRPHPSTTVLARDKRAAPGRASLALQIKEPIPDQSMRTGKIKQFETAALIKVKDEPFTDDLVSLEPLAVVHPERSRSEARSDINTQVGKQDHQQPDASKSLEGIDKGAGKLTSSTMEQNQVKKKETGIPATAPANIEIAASPLGEVKVCLSCNPGRNSLDFHVPDLQTVFKRVEDNCIKTYRVMNPKFSVTNVMRELCECVVGLATNANGLTQDKSCSQDARIIDNNKGTCNDTSLNGLANAESSDGLAAPTDVAVTDALNPLSDSNCKQICSQPNKSVTDNQCTEGDINSVVDVNAKSSVVIQGKQQLDHAGIACVSDMSDITKGQENIKISLEQSNCESPVSFLYIATNVVSHNAVVNFSLAQIGEQDCCFPCDGDCLSLSSPCNCAQRNGGDSPYTLDGTVKEEFLEGCVSIIRSPKHLFMYCKECPLERLKNEDMLDPCKGHLKRRFIKECWTKCGCGRYCGNRVVQRGIKFSLQVFWTPEGKGWGLRTLEDLPKGAFVCEYVGEILTITELQKRNLRSNSKHSYSVVLDTDWGSKTLMEEEVLCLDATFYGNVARFINHRCSDANLIEIPVEVETRSHHYYRVALFATRKIDAFEELTWDYGVDFDDNEHHIKAFRCLCGSTCCRNMKRSNRSRSLTIR